MPFGQRQPMSALGQKPTCALQKGMSALLPIATAKGISAKGHVCFTPEADMCGAVADVRFGPIVDNAAIRSLRRQAARMTRES